MNNNSKNRFSCLLEKHQSKDVSGNIFKNKNKSNDKIKFKKGPSRFSNLKIDEYKDNKFKNNSFYENNRSRDRNYSRDRNDRNDINDRNSFRQKRYKGRGDINNFSRKFKQKEEEKPKVYEYKEEDFPSL